MIASEASKPLAFSEYPSITEQIGSNPAYGTNCLTYSIRAIAFCYLGRYNFTMKPLKQFYLCLGDRQMMPTALKVSALVGSILFSINHGSALIKGQMTSDRWLSGGLTYIVPYLVSIHGQCTSRNRKH